MFLQPPTKSHSSIAAPPCSIMDNEDLIWEVLRCLPIKSLMRFKCVSKLWYSIIRHPKFSIAHDGRGGCFRGLLITDFLDDTSARTRRFFYANFNNSSLKLINQHMTIRGRYFITTSVVKGVIGLYRTDDNKLTLCNIATHELLQLPPSPPSYIDIYDYLLAFDPVNEVYKVLNICPCCDEEGSYKGDLNFHVFTLGANNFDMKWTNIAPPPLNIDILSKQCLCINGALYWRASDVYQRILLAFHPSSETFETIPIPEYAQGSRDLVEICGSPALIVPSDYLEMLDIWTMNNHCKGGEAWSRKRVVLPTCLKQARKLDYMGMLPTGEMMLLGDRQLRNIPLLIYVYDHLKNELNSITIEGCGCQESDLDAQENDVEIQGMKICYYEENIISLDCLMNNHPKNQII